MVHRLEKIIRHLHERIDEAQTEQETTRADGAANKRQRFMESSSQPQPERPIRLQHSRRKRPASRLTPINQAADVILLDEMDTDSDSNSNSDPERVEAEDDGTDGVAQVQHQAHHHASASTPVSSARRQPTSVERLWRCSAVAGGVIPVVFTDPDRLHCSICHELLSAPIFLCDDGHTSCNSCRIRIKNKCPSCRVPNKGFTHCRGMEKLIGALQVECKNSEYGCKETLTIRKKSEHENTCPFTLCFCPLSSCNFARSSSLLYNHFNRHHSSSAISFIYNTIFFVSVERNQKHIILQERNEKVIFILNHEIQGNGRVFNVDCIGPGTLKKAFVYRLTVKTRERCYSMEAIPEICTKWEEHTPDNDFLTIPSCISGSFSLEVCINKAH